MRVILRNLMLFFALFAILSCEPHTEEPRPDEPQNREFAFNIETLTHTNQMLIETLEEVQQIQKDGSVKRKEAEAELGRIEGELKQKLLNLRAQ